MADTQIMRKYLCAYLVLISTSIVSGSVSKGLYKSTGATLYSHQVKTASTLPRAETPSECVGLTKRHQKSAAGEAIQYDSVTKECTVENIELWNNLVGPPQPSSKKLFLEIDAHAKPEAFLAIGGRNVTATENVGIGDIEIVMPSPYKDSLSCEKLPDLPIAAYSVAAALAQSKLYVLGGKAGGDDSILDQVASLDLTMNPYPAWDTSLARMPKTGYVFDVTTDYEEKFIYRFGGKRGDPGSNYMGVMKYDISGDSWTELPVTLPDSSNMRIVSLYDLEQTWIYYGKTNVLYEFRFADDTLLEPGLPPVPSEDTNKAYMVYTVLNEKHSLVIAVLESSHASESVWTMNPRRLGRGWTEHTSSKPVFPNSFYIINSKSGSVLLLGNHADPFDAVTVLAYDPIEKNFPTEDLADHVHALNSVRETTGISMIFVPVDMLNCS